MAAMAGLRISRWQRGAIIASMGLAAAGADYILYTREIDLPTVALVYAIVTVVAAMGVGIRFAGGLSLMALGALTTLGLLQSQRLVPADTDWLEDGIQVADLIGVSVLFLVSGIGAWVSSREAQRSRRRALQLQALAETGKLVANLLHDLTNPVAIARLNLEQLGSYPRSSALDQAMISIHCLERYIVGVRNQMQQCGRPQRFQVEAEIRQVAKLLEYKARWQGVELELLLDDAAWLYGDPVKFNRLMLNMITNGIEAYADLSPPACSARLCIEAAVTRQSVVVTVTDWGTGIAPADMGRLFKPFFTTKGANGTGVGLTIARQIVVDDFGGTIRATSADGETRFTITLPAPPVAAGSPGA